MDGAHGIDAGKAYWVANGTQLIFRGHESRGRSAVFSIPAAGGTPRLLAVFEDPNLSAARGTGASPLAGCTTARKSGRAMCG